MSTLSPGASIVEAQEFLLDAVQAGRGLSSEETAVLQGIFAHLRPTSPGAPYEASVFSVDRAHRGGTRYIPRQLRS